MRAMWPACWPGSVCVHSVLLIMALKTGTTVKDLLKTLLLKNTTELSSQGQSSQNESKLPAITSAL